MNSKSIKLHLGCGKRDFGKDWISIDGGDFAHLHSHDIVNLPFDDNSIDLIYCCHVVEYFDRDDVVKLLFEWNRVLKKDGILRLAVPDFETMARLYVEGKFPLQNFLGPLYGKMKMLDKWIYHKTSYDFHDLKTVLEDSGFINIHLYDRWETDHAQFDDHSAAYLPHMDFENGTCISLNVEATR